jgi:sulfoxide reductase heme-binding subunit YedZ
MAARRQDYLEGWYLWGAISLVLAALALWLASMRGFEEEGVRMVIRYTARTSLLLFCLAFAASAACRLWPNGFTRWQLRNRRHLGLAFATSHLIHAIAILRFAVMAPADYAAATSLGSYVFGGIGYGFIIAMTATSFDATAHTIGPRAWRILHTSGAFYLWFQFTVSFGMRIPAMPNYVWFLVPLLAAMGLRIIAALQARSARTAGAQ